MTQEPIQIDEFNTLCAEYLGLKKYVDSPDEIEGYNNFPKNFQIAYSLYNEYPLKLQWRSLYGRVPLAKLKFHYDWNWIMEVVEKIESENSPVKIMMMSCDIINFNCNCKVEDISKKEAVINAIYRFLKYENNRNNN